MVKKAEDYDEILQKWEKASEEEKEPLEREKQERWKAFLGEKDHLLREMKQIEPLWGYFRPVDWVQPGGSGVFCGISGKAEETSSGKKAYSGSVKLGTMS